MRLLALAFIGQVAAGQIPANLSSFSTFLKANSSIAQVSADAQGYIYAFGETNTSATNGYPHDVFVTRLDPTAANVIYTVNLGGSLITRAGAMTVDAAGNAYVTGWTNSSDFPVVPVVPNPATPNEELPVLARAGWTARWE